MKLLKRQVEVELVYSCIRRLLIKDKGTDSLKPF